MNALTHHIGPVADSVGAAIGITIVHADRATGLRASLLPREQTASAAA